MVGYVVIAIQHHRAIWLLKEAELYGSAFALVRPVFDAWTVSAQHALLLRAGDSYWLKDLNSTNGTQINGVFVTEAALRDGDTIQFGSVTAVFEAGCCKPWSSRGTKMFWVNILS